MFENILSKYEKSGKFTFTSSDSLRIVCNAPTDKSGIYIVLAFKGEAKQLIYIGSSGHKLPDGSIFIRKAKLGGMKDRLVNGKQFGDARKRSWKEEMIKDKIVKLVVIWYVTHNEEYVDCPVDVEDAMQREYYNKFDSLPAWNKQFARK